MDKQTAIELIQNTFQNPFDKGRFIYFIKNLLNRIEDASFTYQGQYIPDAYKIYINRLERIGKYNDGKNKIDILIIKLQKETSLERARTMQRNFVAWYLNGSRGGELKDAALAAFVSPDEEDWRFSLVKMDYKFEQTKTGRIKAKEDFTPARRWSFLVGKNENSHTAQSRLVNILADDKNNPTLAELEQAFDIETVTKEFFIKYRELFIRTKEELDKVVNNDAKIRIDFNTKGVNTVDFAKKLLGQIVFLYFLQKKGWFGVERDAEWGTGSKHFLRELFEKKHGSYKNFFNDILEPLFYEALRIDRSHDDNYYSRFNCKIPFLNGGLFDPIGGYDWVHTDILLPDDLFSNDVKTKEDTGTGILDIFDRYNFTVKEDEPLEKEVAIDPELLGKAYEKFNAIRPDNFEEYKKALKSGNKGEESKFNKQYGVYYTPREIVHYMCQQSLINYLFTKCNPPSPLMGEGKGEGVIITKEDIEALIHYGEMVRENEEHVENKGKETRTYSYKLPESIRNNATLIDQKLSDITVCDPAVGSGAFPVGMMSEIVKIRNVLTTFLSPSHNPSRQGRGNDGGVSHQESGDYNKSPLLSRERDRVRGERTIYDFKRHCIEKSLYGVDIDPGAVEIAKLRLWLSLVVDEDDIKNIKPLPNLDYKIVCGNSLLGVKRDLLNDNLFQDLEKLKQLYFNETNPTKKQEYKNQIDALISRITNGHKEFDFEIYFSEVFHQKGGFDIVIGNPPYVRADSPAIAEQRKLIMQSKQYETLWEKWDLMVPFYEKSLKLLSHEGIHAFIASNSITTSKFAYKLQDWILKNYKVKSIDYFEDDMHIFEAGVVPVVTIIMKTKQDIKPKKIYRAEDFTNIASIQEVDISDSENLRERVFKKSFSDKFSPKIETENLGDICYISYGLRPNSDERYWKGEFTRDDLISETKDAIHPKAYVEGKLIKRYAVEKIMYLEWDTDRVPKKLVRPTFPELYSRPKLMGGVLTGAVFDDTGIVCNHSIVVFVRFIDLSGVNNKSISGSLKKFNTLSRKELEEKSKNYDLKYLLAILNSRYANFYLNNHRRHRLENYFYPDDFRNLPIPVIGQSAQQPFITLVDQILSAKQKDPNADTSALERQIDGMVYKLYGLTEDEIPKIEIEITKTIKPLLV